MSSLPDLAAARRKWSSRSPSVMNQVRSPRSARSFSAVRSAKSPREPSNENRLSRIVMNITSDRTGRTASASVRPFIETGASSMDSFLRTFAMARSHQYVTR